MNTSKEKTERKPRLKNPNDWNELPVSDPDYICYVHSSLLEPETASMGCGRPFRDQPYMMHHEEAHSSILCPDCFASLSAPRNTESIQIVVAEQDLMRVPARFDNLEDAGRFLIARERNERKIVTLNQSIPGHPYDVSYQLAHVIREQFGFTDLRSSYSFFAGEKKPQFLSVQVSPTESAEIYIGEFSIPGMNDSKVKTSPNSAMTELEISIECQQRHKSIAQSLLTRTAERVVNHSIYSGKALTVQVGVNPQTKQEYLLPPKFLPLPKSEPTVYLDDETTAKVQTLETLIAKTELCRELGIATKHGALFHGVYGTGKTLTSQRLAWHATRNGWTYVYCKDTKALSFVMPFVSLYQNVVLFAEDIERAAGDDELQNILDGVQSKSGKNLILILTTNHKDDVPLPLRRPGRFDSVIEFRLPDSKVAGNLAVLFAGRFAGFTSESVGDSLSGLSPAMIRAIVDGAKIAAMHRYDTVESLDSFTIAREDIAVSRSIYADHIAYCSDTKPERKSGYEQIGESVGRIMAAALLHSGTLLEAEHQGNPTFHRPDAAISIYEQCATEVERY